MPTRRTLTVVATDPASHQAVRACLTLLLLVALALPALADPSTPFTQHVRANFQRWDLNKDGTLSLKEIELALPDRSVKGEDAAALAALRFFLVNPPKDPPGFAWTLATLDAYERDVAAHGKLKVNFDGAYNGWVKKLKAANRSLFAPGAPHLESIVQAAQNDCYFLSAVATLIRQRPQDLVSLIRPQEGGGYRVHLPGWGDEVVREPSDAELPAYNQDGGDGVWLLVLDKAVGAFRARLFSNMTVGEDPAELVDRGWDQKSVMWAFTGHKIAILSYWTGGGKSQVPGIEQQARQKLVELAGQHRLIATQAKPGKDPLPQGIERGHVYAVLNYDQGSDMVTVWNPWGTDFHPKSKDPMAGYERHHGQFLVPLHDFVSWFGEIEFEQGN
jgi:hypothetical protein